MRRLQTEELRDFSGALISEMLQIKQPIALATYARKWLRQFPEHEDALDVTAHWLRAYPSAETIAIAAHYLRVVSNSFNLPELVRTSLQIPYNVELYEIIGNRLEREPEAELWCRVLPPFEFSNEHIDKLVLRWFELNKTNQKLFVSHVALFTKSPFILDAAMNWIETTGRKSQFMEWSLLHLYMNARKIHKPLLPRIAKFCRAWLKSNSSSKEYAGVLSTLILSSTDASDIKAGKDWYKKNRVVDRSWYVLSAILRANRTNGEKADPFAIEQAKILLRKLPADKIPALVAAVVDGHQDKETIAMAHKTLAKSNSSQILTTLLKVDPSAELVLKAQNILIQFNESPGGYELLYCASGRREKQKDFGACSKMGGQKSGSCFS